MAKKRPTAPKSKKSYPSEKGTSKDMASANPVALGQRAAKYAIPIVAGVFALYVALVRDVSVLDVQERLGAVALCMIVVMTAWVWPARTRPLGRIVEGVAILIFAAITSLLMLFVLHYNTVRIYYPEHPTSDVTEATIPILGGRNPATFVLNAYVKGQQSPLELELKKSEAGPKSNYPNLDYSRLTTFDRQIQFHDFERPQFLYLTLSTKAPARLILVASVDNSSDNSRPSFLFLEDLDWLTKLSYGSFAALGVVGALVRFWRSRSE